MSKAATPSERADELLTNKDRREALIQRAQLHDTLADMYREDNHMLAVKYRKEAFECRRVARQL